jgi:2-methylaconitate cis-trans-isomerase PrpF
MPQVRIPATFIRGGTSRGLFFLREDLPADEADWDAIFLAALGSPDPHERQLDGLGGGISSLSKVVVVERSERAGVDVEYTFGQVGVAAPVVEYGNNCGNLTAAVGPFAVDAGLVEATGSNAVVRLYNRNTGKHIVSRFPLDQDEAAVDGDFVLQGVAGRGAPIELQFENPEGAVTGRLLPSGSPSDILDVPGIGPVEVSIVDATAVVTFMRASVVGLTGTETPAELEASAALLDRLEAIRRCAAVRAGLAESMDEAARGSRNRPFLVLLAPPRDAASLSAEPILAADVDISARALSMGRPHRALPLTSALCLAAACEIKGSVPWETAESLGEEAPLLRIGHPSGVMSVSATVEKTDDGWRVDCVSAHRTARRLMEGNVLVPQSRLSAGVAR